MEEKKNPVIEMVDNNGNTVHAELYDIFEFENRKYALLVPIDDEKVEGQQSIAVMRLMEDGDSYYIEEIPTDEEFNRIAAYLNGPVQDGDKNCDCGCQHEHHHCCCDDHDDNCGCGNGHGHCCDDDDDCDHQHHGHCCGEGQHKCDCDK